MSFDDTRRDILDRSAFSCGKRDQIVVQSILLLAERVNALVEIAEQAMETPPDNHAVAEEEAES